LAFLLKRQDGLEIRKNGTVPFKMVHMVSLVQHVIAGSHQFIPSAAVKYSLVLKAIVCSLYQNKNSAFEEQDQKTGYGPVGCDVILFGK
jgi:hypothetical protein